MILSLLDRRHADPQERHARRSQEAHVDAAEEGLRGAACQVAGKDGARQPDPQHHAHVAGSRPEA